MAGYLASMQTAIRITKQFQDAVSSATKSVGALQGAIDALHGKDITINVEYKGAPPAVLAGLSGAAAGTAAASRPDVSGINAMIRSEMEALAALQLVDNALGRQIVDMTLAGDAAKQTASVWTMIKTKSDDAKTGMLGDAAAAGAVGLSFMGLLRLMRIGIPLFGGFFQQFGGVTAKLLGSIAVWHLLADVILEIAAVLIPATIAAVAFGAAAQLAAEQVFDHMQAVMLVMSATSRAVAPLSGQFHALQLAMRPDVYQLFGAALEIINSHFKTFSQLATGAGAVFDQFAARITLALSGKGMSQFLTNAVQDLQRLMAVGANILGTFGNLLHSLPGIAEILLRAFEGLTGAVEAFTGSGVIQGLLRWTLAFHGIVIWVGLAVTAVNLLRGPLEALAGWVMSGVRAVVALGIAFEITARQEGIWVAVTSLAQRIGWGWILIGVAALTALVVVLANTKNATQTWVNSLQGAIDSAKTLPQLLNATTTAVVRTNAALVPAQQNVARVGQQMVAGAHGTMVFSMAAAEARNKVVQLAQAHQQFNSELNLENFRLNFLAQSYGGIIRAMGLFTIAGIKVGDVAHANHAQWAQDLQQVQDLVTGWEAMGQTANRLGNDVAAVTFQTGLQDSKVQQLNQAWQTFITTVTGSETGLVGFEQQILGVEQAMTTAGAATLSLSNGTARLRNGVGGISAGADTAAASLNGLNANSLQLRSAFQQAITSGSSFYQALTLQAAAAGNTAKAVSLLNTAGKALVAQLIPLAGRSAFARSEVFALAQEAGYHGVNSMKALAHWTGNMGAARAARELSHVAGTLTTMISNVTTAADNLSNALGQQLNNALAGTLVNFGTIRGAAENFRKVLLNSNSTLGQGHSAYTTLLNDLLLSGMNYDTAKAKVQGYALEVMKQKLAQDQLHHASMPQMINDLITIGTKAGLSKGAIDKLVVSLLKIPKSQQDLIKVLISGQATGTVSISRTAVGGLGGGQRTAAAGGLVTGPGSSTSDSIPARLSTGEYVVKAAAVAKYGKHMMDTINAQRFQGGGFVARAGGNLDVIGGAAPRWVDQFHRSFDSRFQSVFTSDLRMQLNTDLKAALAAAIAQARSAMMLSMAGAAGGGSAVAIGRRMAAAQGWTGSQWTALFNLWMRESGWNPYAVNPSSGAYGIPQCYPVDMMILTRRGWLKHNEVRVGDETVGYNPETGYSEWTKITAVLHPGVHPVVRYGNSQVEFTTTPNHRWLMRDKRVRATRPAEQMRQIQDRLTDSILILAKPHYAEGGLPITLEEAALLGWIAGDGWERKAYPKYGTGRRGGSPATFHIGQTKQENWPDIEHALAGHGSITRTRERTVRGESRMDREWRLNAPYARDLAERAGNPKTDHRAMILAMSSAQRKAWLDAMFLAEGSVDSRTHHRSISQNDGSLAETIRLAVYLEGYRPSVYRRTDKRYNTENLIIGFVKPALHVGHPGFFYEGAGEQEVWCVTTELGSFTAEQNGHIHLTGNSLGHGHPYALGDAAAQIAWGLGYIRSRYGSPLAAWGHELQFGWYDRGGRLPPGLSLAMNTTGRDEIHTAGGGTNPIVVSVQVDGRELLRALAVQSYRYDVRNSGTPKFLKPV